MLKEMVEFLNSNVSGCGATLEEREKGDTPIFVNGTHILEVCKTLKESSEYDMTSLEVVTGCDYEDRIEVSYIMSSFRKNIDAIIKVKLPKSSPSDVPTLNSVCSVWKAANFQERECYDMMGVNFEGHPDLRRILCPEDWTGYPLRKDYVVEEVYNGMTVNPEEKVNIADHHFFKKLQEEVGDPKKVTYSWKGE